MGAVVSQSCKKCSKCLSFLPIIHRKKQQEQSEDRRSEISSTEQPTEYTEFLEIYNRPLPEGCDKLCEKDGFIVFGSDLPEGFLIKAQWTSNFSPSAILTYFRNPSERKQWDKNVEEIQELSGGTEDEYRTYTKFKKVIAISQRDALIVSNVYQRTDGLVVVSRSCEDPKFPENDNVTRMQIFLAGYYFKNTDENGKTLVFTLTKAHFGGSISQSFIKKATALAIPKMYQAMEKGMNAYYKTRGFS
jgi:hypothetical protein